MSKQIINNNALFTIYTESERKTAFKDFMTNKAITHTDIVTIKKLYDSLVGITANGYIYPLRQYQNQIKVRQKYKLYLDDYDRVIKIEKL